MQRLLIASRAMASARMMFPSKKSERAPDFGLARQTLHIQCPIQIPLIVRLALKNIILRVRRQVNSTRCTRAQHGNDRAKYGHLHHSRRRLELAGTFGVLTTAIGPVRKSGTPSRPRANRGRGRGDGAWPRARPGRDGGEAPAATAAGGHWHQAKTWSPATCAARAPRWQWPSRLAESGRPRRGARRPPSPQPACELQS